MCGCTLKSILASSPARATESGKSDGVNGPPRSEAKTDGSGRLALQLSQRPQFVAPERMRSFLAALGFSILYSLFSILYSLFSITVIWQHSGER